MLHEYCATGQREPDAVLVEPPNPAACLLSVLRSCIVVRLLVCTHSISVFCSYCGYSDMLIQCLSKMGGKKRPPGSGGGRPAAAALRSLKTPAVR